MGCGQTRVPGQTFERNNVLAAEVGEPMRMLLSTIGSRGEVQPLLALALGLRDLDHDVRVCVPPDFRDWIVGMGVPVVPVGPEVRGTAARASTLRRAMPSAEGRRKLIEATVATQFETIPHAARGCDVVVGCGPLQIAARSAAELLGIEYVHAHYCPVTLPSPHHAPLPLPGWAPDEAASYREQWEMDARRWNDTWGPAFNAQRASVGLAPVEDVRNHVFTDRPWLAADAGLAPWPGAERAEVFQTGAWILPDERPLSAELEAFLQAGEPPVYLGLGSMGAPGEDVGLVMVEAARALGRRAIVSRGWAELPLPDDGPDCISIGEANHRALFPRLAAVVHHGGAGTTTTVARAGVPQVAVPQRYDQPYWAGRIEDLGIGVGHDPGMPTSDSLAAALDHAMRTDVAARARALAPAVRTDGALVAAGRLASEPRRALQRAGRVGRTDSGLLRQPPRDPRQREVRRKRAGRGTARCPDADQREGGGECRQQPEAGQGRDARRPGAGGPARRTAPRAGGRRSSASARCSGDVWSRLAFQPASTCPVNAHRKAISVPSRPATRSQEMPTEEEPRPRSLPAHQQKTAARTPPASRKVPMRLGVRSGTGGRSAS